MSESKSYKLVSEEYFGKLVKIPSVPHTLLSVVGISFDSDLNTWFGRLIGVTDIGTQIDLYNIDLNAVIVIGDSKDE